jgi:hypothetical protein
MGKDDNNGKDDDSKDDSNDSKDGNNDGGNGNSGGGSVSAVSGQGNVRLVAVICRALVVWHLHTVGIIQICFGINLFWSKFYLAYLDMPNSIYSICTYSRFILCLFWSKSGSNPFRPILAVTQHYEIKKYFLIINKLYFNSYL